MCFKDTTNNKSAPFANRSSPVSQEVWLRGSEPSIQPASRTKQTAREPVSHVQRCVGRLSSCLGANTTETTQDTYTDRSELP